MSLSRRVLSGFAVCCLAGVVLNAQQPTTWKLNEVLKRAADKVEAEDSSVQNARLELAMLEALSRTRVELRPQLSLLSFSNPLFLAASLGSSFSVNRRTAPSPVNMELARYGVVEAELNHVTRRVNAELDVTREFFALTSAQETVTRNCTAWAARGHDRDAIQVSVAAKRITRLDAIRFEQDVTALESECLEAKAQARNAGASLMRLVGATVPDDQAHTDTQDLTERIDAAELLVSDELVKAIFQSREQLKTVSEHVSNLSSAVSKRRFQFESVAAGYSYLKNVDGSSSITSKNYLLGGNVGHFNLNFVIPLRNIGDGTAAAAFLDARAERIQARYQELQRTVRYAVEDNERRASLTAARLELAQRRQHLAEEFRALTLQRIHVGLETSSDELWAARDAERASMETARLQSELRQSFYTVLALCDPEHLVTTNVLAHSRPASHPAGKTEQGDAELITRAHVTPRAAIQQIAAEPVSLAVGDRQEQRK